MSDNLETIEVTIMKETLEGLQKNAETLNLTIGEVIDRYVLSFPVEDPDTAMLLLMNTFWILVSRQTHEQLMETIESTSSMLLTLAVACGDDNQEFYNRITRRASECIQELRRYEEAPAGEGASSPLPGSLLR